MEVLVRDLRADPLVQESLSVGHVAVEDNLCLGCDLLLDILLESAQHKWLQHSMKSLQLNLVQLSLVEALSFDVFAKPLLELFVVLEKLGHNKVKQGPQFCHAVLDWGTR